MFNIVDILVHIGPSCLPHGIYIMKLDYWWLARWSFWMCLFIHIIEYSLWLVVNICQGRLTEWPPCYTNYFMPSGINSFEANYWHQSSSSSSSAWRSSQVFSLKQPCPPWHVQNTVHAMLALSHPHIFVIHGTSLSQEHLTIFNISEGIRPTFSLTLVGIREFEPSSLTHPWLWGSKVGGFGLKACLHMVPAGEPRPHFP